LDDSSHLLKNIKGHRGRDRMVVGFTTTHATSVPHQATL